MRKTINWQTRANSIKIGTSRKFGSRAKSRKTFILIKHYED